MTDLGDLSDDELFKRAQELRLRTKLGDGQARAAALACEEEARRRFRTAPTLSASLEDFPPSKGP
jgi:hypothetical protein